MVDIVIVAGEASGDQLAADLMRRLRALRPEVRFHGVAGPAMRSVGIEAWGDIETLAVRGLFEVLPTLPRILRLKRELLARIERLRPALFIGVDAPDFNLRLEYAVKTLGIPTVHYVCPTFWAWRPERVRSFAERIDHMLCIFPFEPQLLQPHGVSASFVGHPLTRAKLIAADRTRLRRPLMPEGREDRADTTPIVALLPGSRRSEVELHAPLYVDTLIRLAEALPEAIFLVPLITRATRERFQDVLWRRAPEQVQRVRLLYGHADYALRAADVALVASGTATLEAAMLDCPQVVTYRLRWLTYWLIKRKIKTPWVAQPNIIAQREVVPERLQKAATADKLAQDILSLLKQPERMQAMRSAYAEIRSRLAMPGPGDALAAAVQGLLPR